MLLKIADFRAKCRRRCRQPSAIADAFAAAAAMSRSRAAPRMTSMATRGDSI